MKVTGITLREGMRKWQTRLEVAAKQFTESLWQFPDDNRKLASPTELSKQFLEADEAIAAIQTAQQQYNLNNIMDFRGKKISLAMAVKLIGGAGRHEKMWRSAATDSGRDKYSYRENTRKADDIHAERQVTVADAMRHAEEASSYASALRSVIALANAKEMEVTLDSKYLD